MGKLSDVVDTRISLANRFLSLIADLPGISGPLTSKGDIHTYWKLCLQIDANEIPGGAVALGNALKSHGIFSAPRYIQKPAFDCEIFREQRTFGQSRWPFTLARPEAVDYSRDNFPGAYAGLERILVLPWTEGYTHEHVDYIAGCLSNCVEQLRSAR
jgi:dTDP-4-amino-4,6-dideoxygalactose transaminase